MIAALLLAWLGIQIHQTLLANANIVNINANRKLRGDFVCIDDMKVDLNSNHKVVIATKQLNLDHLENFVHKVSDPSSQTYGKFLSRKEVGDLTINEPALDAVREYLRANDIMEYQETLNGEYFTVLSTLDTWEKLFGAKFMAYKHTFTEEIYFRSSVYELPPVLAEHVFAVYNIVELPFLDYANRFRANANAPLTKDIDFVLSFPGYITPAVLNSRYNIFTNQGNSLTSQTIYSASGQYFSSTDLASFQSDFGIPSHPVDSDVNTRNQPSQCIANPNNCGESNLDLQYIMSVAQNTPTSIM